MSEWVSTWFEDFYSEHARRIGRHDFPAYNLQDPFVDSWRRNLSVHKITKQDAEQASLLVASNPPNSLSQQLQAFVDEAKKIQSARAVRERKEVEASRDQAESDSWDCPECDGEGWAIRDYAIPDRYGSHRFKASLFCRCSLGRYFEKWYRMNNHEAWVIRDDLQALPFLWREDYRHKTWTFEVAPQKVAYPSFVKTRIWCETGEC